MATIDVVNLSNEKTGTIDLPDSVFKQKVNQPLVLQVIKAQLAGMRQGTASSKTKSEVRGGGKKPFGQKGTGNARQGSNRSPLMPGGGSSFGPRPRKYNQNTPKQMVRGALRCVLSDKLASNVLIIVDDFKVASHKTKDLSKILEKKFKVKSSLIVDGENKNLKLSSGNLANSAYCRTDGVNVYDLVRYKWLLISKSAVKLLSDKLSE